MVAGERSRLMRSRFGRLPNTHVDSKSDHVSSPAWCRNPSIIDGGEDAVPCAALRWQIRVKSGSTGESVSSRATSRHSSRHCEFPSKETFGRSSHHWPQHLDA
jgi:hypothetical protein